MQTTIKLAVIMLLLVTAFSCQKETDNPTTKQITGVLKAANDPTYLLDVDADQWCTSPGSNCASTVVIVGKKIEKMTDMANDPTAITEFFSTSNYSEWSVLFPHVAENPQLLDLLQTGKITFEILQDPSTNARSIVRMHNSDNSLSIGFPFQVQ